MNDQEKNYFDRLTKDRSASADTLEKPSMRGIKNSVVEKYSDQAHFIYELLQNADDAKATNARFILLKDKLLFAHNGKRHFSISDPDKEDRDVGTGNLGDINAITSIANSNKTEASIGKFGVGFKAVFQYTSTPQIYDSKFWFRIDRFIVPILLSKDHPARRPDETLFVFPFDHTDRSSEEAFNDISNKLRNLSYPLLFLTNLKDIEYEFDKTIGLYEKRIETQVNIDKTVAQKIILTQNDGDELYDNSIWLFTRKDNADRQYSVGYFVDGEGNLKPANVPAFCFFPTKETTGLKFIIHAPFLLTDSREGIRAGIKHNEKMIDLLSELAADSISYLIQLGEKEGRRLIDDNILNIIPYDPDVFTSPDDKSRISFLPFYRSIKYQFSTQPIIPTKNGYIESKNAYWPAVTQLADLFSDEQLAEICPNDSAKWVFCSFGREEVQRNNRPLFNYLEQLVFTNINEDAITTGRTRDYYYDRVSGIRKPLESIKGIDAAFIEHQDIAWLHKFYKWLSESVPRTNRVKKRPIFLNQDKEARAAFDQKDQLVLFLPIKDSGELDIIDSELLEDEETRNFIKQIGIKEPSLRDQIYNIILPQYGSGAEIDTDPHFQIFFRYYCECPNEEIDDYIELIKDCEFITFYDSEDNQAYREKASSLYLPTPELLAFFETKKNTKFIALDEYKEMVGKKNEDKLLSFLKHLGIRDEVQIISQTIDGYSRQDLPHHYSTRYKTWEENIIDGCKDIIDYIVDNEDQNKSVLLWNCLLNIIEKNCGTWKYGNLEDLLSGVYRYFYRTNQVDYFESSDSIYLRESTWLFNNERELVSPDEITVDEISQLYDTVSFYGKKLVQFLKIAEKAADESEEYEQYLTDDQKRKIALADKLEQAGLDETDIEEWIEYKKRKKAKDNFQSSDDYFDEDDDFEHEQAIDYKDGEDEDNQDTSDIEVRKESRGKPDAPKINDRKKAEVINDIIEKTEELENNGDSESAFDNDYEDSDEYTPKTVDYSRLIERANLRNLNEINRIAQYKDLQNKANGVNLYKGWHFLF